MISLLYQLLHDDGGQDIVEYTLLTATIALASIVALAAIGPVINAIYTSWDTSTQDIWEPQAPTP